MNTSISAERRRKIGGLCLMAAPALMLAGDVMHIGAGLRSVGIIMLKLSFALFVAAILALVHLLRERADGTGLVGGALAIVGCLAGSAIVTVGMVQLSLEAAALGGPVMRAVEDAMAKGGVWEALFLYPLPGPAFPLGLLVLSYGLLRARVVPAPAAILLALGAVLFPVGRIGGIAPAVLSSSVALTAALGWIGWRILKRTTPGWEQVTPAVTLA